MHKLYSNTSQCIYSSVLTSISDNNLVIAIYWRNLPASASAGHKSAISDMSNESNSTCYLLKIVCASVSTCCYKSVIYVDKGNFTCFLLKIKSTSARARHKSAIYFRWKHFYLLSTEDISASVNAWHKLVVSGEIICIHYLLKIANKWYEVVKHLKGRHFVLFTEDSKCLNLVLICPLQMTVLAISMAADYATTKCDV